MIPELVPDEQLQGPSAYTLPPSMRQVMQAEAERTAPERFLASRFLPHGAELLPGSLTWIVARTGVGKSFYIAELACDFAANGCRVLIFSSEMSGAQYARRLATRAPGVSVTALRENRHTWADAARELDYLERVHLAEHVRDHAAILERCLDFTAATTAEGLEPVICLDYLQGFAGATYEDVSAASRLALDIAHNPAYGHRAPFVIGAVQANTRGESAAGPVTLTASKGSGNVEQDGALIIGLSDLERPADDETPKTGKPSRPWQERHLERLGNAGHSLIAPCGYGIHARLLEVLKDRNGEAGALLLLWADFRNGRYLPAQSGASERE